MPPFVLLQRALPQRLLTLGAGWLAHRRIHWLKRLLIKAFVRAYQVDLSEAATPDLEAFPDFQSFFTRPLRTGARPLPTAPEVIVSPCDGHISEAGALDGQRLMQAKGQGYDAATLLGSTETAAQFAGGSFATLYLAPPDYHRVHMPIAGRLQATRYIPGALFAVNPATVAGRPRLFARNERLVCLFQTAVGPMAVVLVAALFVGGIRTTWGGRVGRRTRPGVALAPESATELARGEELGAFEMGSTTIVCLPAGAAYWRAGLVSGARVRMGESIGNAIGNATGNATGHAINKRAEATALRRAQS